MKINVLLVVGAAIGWLAPLSITLAADADLPEPKARPESESSSSRRRPSAAARLSAVVKREASPYGIVIVHKAKPVGTRHAEMVQDMQIMAHLLGKILHQSGQEETPQAMGISLDLAAGRTTRHFFLEGEGAIFTFAVEFPLAPASRASSETQTNAVTSEWEKAQRALFGRRYGEAQANQRPVRKFDQAAIDRLQGDLVRVLKNAHHMRHLRSDEKVTIIVSQAPGGVEMITWKVEDLARVEGNGPSISTSSRGSATQSPYGSTLQISARKGDIDSFAASKLTFEQFRDRVVAFAY